DEEKKKLTVDDLLMKFRENVGKSFDNDRMMLGK
ncbi:MAG: ABC transporter ATP-binding protein, partial [Clostridia bacterium]|nr:ABC transporter ATP-binding protein [Clostridia bacterium]